MSITNRAIVRTGPGWPASLLAAVLVSALWSVPGSAQGGAPQPAAPAADSQLERRLAQLNTTLERIALLLERQVRLQETDLFYRRLEVLDATLSGDRQALREARDRMRQEEAEAKALEALVEQYEQQQEAATEEEGDPVYIEAQIEQLKDRIEMIKDSRRDLTVYVADLETRIQRREEDLAALQEDLAER